MILAVRTVSAAPFTSPLAESLSEGLLERFLRYVSVDTQSCRERTSSPSTPGQLELGRMLVRELHQAGIADAALDGNGYVTATLAATDPEAPVIGLIAHLDTSPDAPGAGVVPIVHREYEGGVLELPLEGTRLDPAAIPELVAKRGHDIVTASGDTLLGADDKAGVAAIMAAAAHLAAHPELPRPTLRIAFTPDEEIGEGATLFDIERFGALCAYTIDGSELGELQDETFTASEVIVTVRGVEVHPGQATGKLVNALRLAAQIVAALPSDRLDARDHLGPRGIHPSLRAHRRRRLTRRSARSCATSTTSCSSATSSCCGRRPRRSSAPSPGHASSSRSAAQYRNMRHYIDRVPQVVEAADAAIRAEGIEPRRGPIRGGTDGSRLSEMGLPTPNIFDGGHEYHSVREWASLQDMAAAAATIVRLAEVWARLGARDVDARVAG